MKRMVFSLIRFGSFFFLVTIIFWVVDLSVWDYKGNVYANDVIETGSTAENIVIGSSKVYWSFIDTLLPEATILGDGGQYNYASLTIFLELEAKGLLKNKIIWLDLADDSELMAGFGKWWYFNEAFLKYKFASFTDYPMSDWPDIIARIYVDIFTFTPNKSKPFKWTGIDEMYPRKVDEKGLNNHLTRFTQNTNEIPISKAFRNSVLRFMSDLDEIEQRNNCKVKFLILEAPNWRGNLKDYFDLFGTDRTVSLLPQTFDASEYNDGNHLNSIGALRVSKLLKHEMELEEENKLR